MTEDTSAPPVPPRRRSRLRLTLLGFGAILVLLVGGIATLLLTFDPNSLKPRIQDAARQATGRELALNGAIGVKLSLWPTIAVRDVTFANPPGFSRPQMATLETLELQLALLPLLSRRVEIERLVLVAPDIRLETNADGRSNWDMAPPDAPARPPSGQTGGAPKPEEPPPFAHVRDLRIERGALSWRDGRGGSAQDVAIRTLSIESDSPDAPVRIDAQLAVNAVAASLKGETGPLSRLLGGATGAPFPVRVTAEVGGASVRVEGSLADPMRGRGYDATLSLSIPDAAALAPLLPGVSLPPARDIALSLRVADTGAALPAISAISVKTGAIDLAALTGGVRIDRAEITAPSETAPIAITVAGRRSGVPVTISGSVSHPGFDPAKPRPLELDLRATAGEATVTLKGRMASPSTLSGVAMEVAARVPDLAALAPLAERPLPPLRDIALSGQVADTGKGLPHGVVARNVSLRLPQADLAGDIGATLDGRPSITATLKSERIDIDALRAVLARLEPAPPPAAPGAAPAEKPAPSPRPQRSNRLIPDTPLPFGQLDLVNVDARVSIGTLRSGKADYQGIEARLAMQDGRLRLDPFAARTPEGRISGTLDVDSTQAPPRVRLTAQAPGLSLAAILADLGMRPMASGQLEVHANLSGAGTTPAAIAASLNGTVGVAMAGGTLDTRQLSGSLGSLAKDLAVLDLMGRGGGVADIRCVAIRFDATDGVARARTLLLSSSLITADGGGSINLRSESLDLLLRPQGRVGGTGFRIPVKVAGPMAGPKVEVDATGAAEANVDKLAGIVIGGATPLGALGGLLGSEAASNQASACPVALATARGGAVTETAASPAATATPPTQSAPSPARPASRPAPTLPNPGRLLQQLFR